MGIKSDNTNNTPNFSDVFGNFNYSQNKFISNGDANNKGKAREILINNSGQNINKDNLNSNLNTNKNDIYNNNPEAYLKQRLENTPSKAPDSKAISTLLENAPSSDLSLSTTRFRQVETIPGLNSSIKLNSLEKVLLQNELSEDKTYQKFYNKYNNAGKKFNILGSALFIYGLFLINNTYMFYSSRSYYDKIDEIINKKPLPTPRITIKNIYLNSAVLIPMICLMYKYRWDNIRLSGEIDKYIKEKYLY